MKDREPQNNWRRRDDALKEAKVNPPTEGQLGVLQGLFGELQEKLELLVGKKPEEVDGSGIPPRLRAWFLTVPYRDTEAIATIALQDPGEERSGVSTPFISFKTKDPDSKLTTYESFMPFSQEMSFRGEVLYAWSGEDGERKDKETTEKEDETFRLMRTKMSRVNRTPTRYSRDIEGMAGKGQLSAVIAALDFIVKNLRPDRAEWITGAAMPPLKEWGVPLKSITG